MAAVNVVASEFCFCFFYLKKTITSSNNKKHTYKNKQTKKRLHWIHMTTVSGRGRSIQQSSFCPTVVVTRGKDSFLLRGTKVVVVACLQFCDNLSSSSGFWDSFVNDEETYSPSSLRLFIFPSSLLTSSIEDLQTTGKTPSAPPAPPRAFTY